MMSYLTEEEFQKHLQGMQNTKYLIVDTEGTLNHPFSQTWGISTSAHGVSEYFAFKHRFGQNLPLHWLSKFKEVIERHPCLVFHNAKHDLRALDSIGIHYKGKFYDTMLMAHMIDENLYSKELSYLSKHFGGLPKEMPEAAKKIIDAVGWDGVPVEFMRSYADNDAYITEELFYKLLAEFQAQGFDGELWDWEQKWVRLLCKIENNGILIDQDLSSRELERGLAIMSDLQRRLGFNPASPIDLGKFFLEDLKLPVVKVSKKTDKPSFDKEVLKVYDELLQQNSDPRADMVLTYRGWLKTTSSNYRPYLNLLHTDGRLRPNYKIHGTHTCRLSCEKPNLQQIPKTSSKDWNGGLKKAFITEAGRTPWELDYSQGEFRLAAAYGKVEKLLEIFADPTRDIFTEMAKDLGMTRDLVKTLNYLLQYGGGEGKIMVTFGVSHLAAKAIKGNYYKNYPGLAQVANLALMRAKERGYVQYWSGRRRHLPFLKSDEGHLPFNSAIQGGFFEIVKRQMIRVDEAGLNNDECRIDLQVHDSVRTDIEDGKEDIYLPEIKRILESVEPDFGVRWRVDCKKWGEK